MSGSPIAASGEVSERSPDIHTESLKKGAIGTRHISAMVIAAAAPIAGVVGIVPLTILLGNGVGTPGAIFSVALVLAVFAVGFVRVVPYIRNAGALYAYVSQGLGKPAGLGSAYATVVAYLALTVSTVSGFGFFGAEMLQRLAGVSVPWWVLGLAAMVLSSFCGWLGVTLAARVLLVILTLEIVGISVLDIAILAHQGLHAFSLDAINPHVVFSGSFAVAIIYSFGCFLGFEGTAIYSEEAKQPLRTIPRATYTVIAIVGIFYGLSAWALIAGAGFSDAVARDAQAPGQFVFGLSDQYVGSLWSDIISVLVVTSLFAGVLAFQNAGARYFFALSRDGVLARRLAQTDARRGTPTPAILLFGGIVSVAIVLCAVARLDPLLQVSTSMTGLGAIGLVGLLTVASVSIAVFFYRKGVRRITTIVVPLLAALLLAACAVAGLTNFAALTGTDSPLVNNLIWLYVPFVAAGIGVALYVKRHRPDTYAVLGTTRVD